MFEVDGVGVGGGAAVDSTAAVRCVQRPAPRLTFNTFVYHAAAVDTTTSDLSQQQSKLKMDDLSTVHKNTSKAKRADFKATLEKQGARKSSRLI